MCQASLDAGQRYRESYNKESRFITHPQITDPIPRTEQSLNVKLARKLPQKKRAKRQLAGLYEVLKPGSFVTESSPTTTIINEPGRTPVKSEIVISQNLELKPKDPPTCGYMPSDALLPTKRPQNLRSRSIVTILRNRRGAKSKLDIDNVTLHR